MNHIAELDTELNEALAKFTKCQQLNRVKFELATNGMHQIVIEILRAVEAETGENVETILGTQRGTSVGAARNAAFILSRELTALSFHELGRQFGGRDGSTVAAGIRRGNRSEYCKLIVSRILPKLKAANP